jgi:hypothetical protein
MRTLLGRGARSRLLLITVVAGVLAACGASSSAVLSNVGNPINNGGQGTSGEFAAPSAAASAAPAARAPGDNGSQSGGDPAAIDNSLQIVYTGSLQLVVADVDQALAKAKAAVAAAGGYIGGSQESNADTQPTATITYRIPASRWEDTIAAIRGVATKVVAEQTQASEVGSQLVDLQARLANLRASEAALQDIAKGTAKVSDLLEVQAQLTDVRGQIEQLDAQRVRLTDQVAYGTLVTTFGMEVEQVKTAAKGWDPATDVDGASAAMISFGQRLVSAAIWFVIVWLPSIAVTLLVLFVAWKVGKRFLPKPSPIAPSGPVAGWGGDKPPKA